MESSIGQSWPTPDTWRKGTSFAGFHNDPELLSCSYCGSIHPDIFMAKIKEGWTAGPTDKNYKVYLGMPIEPYTLPVGDITIDTKDVGKFYFQHLSEEQRVEFVELLNQKAVKIGYPGYFYNLPFFIQRKSAV